MSNSRINPREALTHYGDHGLDAEKTKVIVSIPSNAVGTLVGPRGQTIEKIERETNCFIQVLRGERFSPEKHNKNHRHRAPLTDICIQSWGDAGKIQSCLDRLSSLLMGMVAIRKVYPPGVSNLDCHFVKIYQVSQTARNLNAPNKDNLNINSQVQYTQPVEERSEFVFQTPWRYTELKTSVISNLEKRSTAYYPQRPTYPSPPRTVYSQPEAEVKESPRRVEAPAPKSGLRDRRNMSTLALGTSPKALPCFPTFNPSTMPLSPSALIYNPYVSNMAATPRMSAPYPPSQPNNTVLTLPQTCYTQQAGYATQMSAGNPEQMYNILNFPAMTSPKQFKPYSAHPALGQTTDPNLATPVQSIYTEVAQPVNPAKPSEPPVPEGLTTIAQPGTQASKVTHVPGAEEDLSGLATVAESSASSVLTVSESVENLKLSDSDEDNLASAKRSFEAEIKSGLTGFPGENNLLYLRSTI